MKQFVATWGLLLTVAVCVGEEFYRFDGQDFTSKELQKWYSELRLKYCQSGTKLKPLRECAPDCTAIRGRISQVVNDNTVLVRSGGETIALLTPLARRAVDDDSIQCLGRYVGRYQYTSVLGAKTTIRQYTYKRAISFQTFMTHLRRWGLLSEMVKSDKPSSGGSKRAQIRRAATERIYSNR